MKQLQFQLDLISNIAVSLFLTSPGLPCDVTSWEAKKKIDQLSIDNECRILMKLLQT